jgi:hypothetical protein
VALVGSAAGLLLHHAAADRIVSNFDFDVRPTARHRLTLLCAC